jgi:hypothetical protein
MSRRSRRAPKKAASLPGGITTGLGSLVEGNESIIASMLSVDDLPKDTADAKAKTILKLVTSLTDCMAVNNLSAEALLARFFDASVLRSYCESRLGVSGKGNEATLAARIAKAWSKPDFEPLPLEEESGAKDSEPLPLEEESGAKEETKSKKVPNTVKRRRI